MTQRGDRGSFAYSVTADRSSYALRLHRALKRDYVLTGSIVAESLAATAGQPPGRDPAAQRAHPQRLRRPVVPAARRRPARGRRDGAGRRRGDRASRLAPGPRRRRRHDARHGARLLHLRSGRRRRLHPDHPPPLRRLPGRRHRAVACGDGAQSAPARRSDPTASGGSRDQTHARRRPGDRRPRPGLRRHGASRRGPQLRRQDRSRPADCSSRATSTPTGRRTSSSTHPSPW